MTEQVDEEFDALVRCSDAAMIVVTVAVDGERSGCLVGFHTQCSINPRRYAVWLSKANHTYELALRAEAVAVHFLADDERALAVLFGATSGDDIDKFDRTPWTDGPRGVPLLDECATRMVLRRHALFDAGEDHVCLIGDPIESTCGATFTPLRLSYVDDLEPGHEADEQRHGS